MELRDFKEQDLADIIKKEEKVFDILVDVNKPIFVRCDGRSFKTFTKGFKKPFDKVFRNTMEKTLKDVLEEVQCATLGYTQSDEITIMFEKQAEESQIIFAGRVQKIITTCASTASVSFNKYFIEETEKYYKEELARLEEIEASEKKFEELHLHIAKMRNKYFKAHFDGRIFNLDEDIKYLPFVWRYLDCHKNAVQMVARSEFSNKEISHKHTNDMIEMLKKEKDIDFYSLEKRFIDGVCMVKKEVKLNEGTKKECIRNKWTIVDAKELFETFLNDNEASYLPLTRKEMKRNE